MKHVCTARQGNQKLFLEFYDRLTALSDEKLIEAYYREVNLGMTGVHAQAVYALPFKKQPIFFPYGMASPFLLTSRKRDDYDYVFTEHQRNLA